MTRLCYWHPDYIPENPPFIATRCDADFFAFPDERGLDDGYYFDPRLTASHAGGSESERTTAGEAGKLYSKKRKGQKSVGSASNTHTKVWYPILFTYKPKNQTHLTPAEFDQTQTDLYAQFLKRVGR